MSKANSYHFKSTTGSFIAKAINSAIIETKESPRLDFREHPTQYKQLGSKKRKQLKEKLDNRTMTREEYKHYRWNQRFNRRRNKGIDNFWKREVILLRQGKPGTRNWSEEQKLQILRGERPKYKGKAIESHHTYSASKYPHLANIGFLIMPLTHEEHFKGWHGGNYSQSLPGKPIKKIVNF